MSAALTRYGRDMSVRMDASSSRMPRRAEERFPVEIGLAILYGMGYNA